VGQFCDGHKLIDANELFRLDGDFSPLVPAVMLFDLALAVQIRQRFAEAFFHRPAVDRLSPFQPGFYFFLLGSLQNLGKLG